MRPASLQRYLPAVLSAGWRIAGGCAAFRAGGITGGGSAEGGKA